MDPHTPARPLGLVGATLVASIAAVVSLVTSAVVVSRAYLARGDQDATRTRSLEVTGSARKRIRSDLAVWEIKVSGESKTLEDSFARLAASVDAVRAFLGAHGFAGDAVSIGAVDTTIHRRYDDHGRDTREVLSYQLTRRLEVRSADVDAVARAAGEVTELLKNGASVESVAPRYLYTKLADLKVVMIGEATADGRDRAERIAAGSRCRVGAVKDARAGVLQITPPWSVDVSSSGMNDTSSIEKDIASVVHLTFAIEPL